MPVTNDMFPKIAFQVVHAADIPLLHVKKKGVVLTFKVGSTYDDVA
jgi:hypothetical protein